jgi:hypothetical protein
MCGPHEPALRDGSAIPQARSGRGPGEGFLVDTRRSNGGRLSRALQMPEELPDHLAVRDGGDDPQRPLLTERAAHHVKSKDALEQPRPAPVRHPRVRLLVLHTLLAWRREDGPAQVAVRRQKVV